MRPIPTRDQQDRPSQSTDLRARRRFAGDSLSRPSIENELLGHKTLAMTLRYSHLRRSISLTLWSAPTARRPSPQVTLQVTLALTPRPPPLQATRKC